MKFIVQDQLIPLDFTLIYRAEEYSFDITTYERDRFTSILIDFLEINVNEEGYLRSLGGFCNITYYQNIDIAPKNCELKSIVVVPDEPFIPWISVRYNENNEWPRFINKKEGWVCLGDPTTEGKRLVQYAPQCVASLVGEDLVALWLHPESLPKNLPPGQSMPTPQTPGTS